MAKLLLVRHGETEWNKAGRFQGHTDVELNDTGRWQAERLRDRFAGQRIDVGYSSDLKRTVDTAQIVVSGRGLTVIPCKELREIDFGELEGMTFDEIRCRYPTWGDRNSEVSIPGGESLEQLTSRVKLFASWLGEQHSGDETVLIVAHGALLRVLVCVLLGIDVAHWRQIRVDSVSLTIVDIYPGWVVLSLLNDTSHLESHSE